ncbi:ABC transporter [Microbacterium sp. P04]|uniref:ABC transporter n=1 Tax=Microbacterium sp. P04 TaxID=3366947 RepID=UPI003744EB93
MSDPKSSYGEPVDEPNEVDDDVVRRANAALAEAEAAQRDAVPGEPDAVPPRDEPETIVVTDADGTPETVVVEETPATQRTEDRVEPDGVPWYERDDVPLDDEPAARATEPVTAREPVQTRDADYSRDEPSYRDEPAVAPVVAPAAQPIFVQAPEAPRPRGNRGAAGVIGLLAAVVFAVLYLAAWLGLELIYGGIVFADVPQAALDALGTWALWLPVVAFFLGFWLLGAFINRGRWGHWVVWGLLVGLAAYGGHLLGQLFQAPFWMLTAREGATLLEDQLLAPLAIVAFVLGRELTIWFGAWVAARGRRATELNDAAQREYERTLEAGPQLTHA